MSIAHTDKCVLIPFADTEDTVQDGKEEYMGEDIGEDEIYHTNRLPEKEREAMILKKNERLWLYVVSDCVFCG